MSDLGRFGLALRRTRSTVELIPLHVGNLESYSQSLIARRRTWLENSGFDAKPEIHVTRRDRTGAMSGIYVGIESNDETILDPYNDMYALTGWFKDLDPGVYELSDTLDLTAEQKYKLTLGWALAAYSFDKYKSKKETKDRRLVIPKGIDKVKLLRALEATFLAQDLINEPPNALGVEHMIGQATSLAQRFNAEVKVIRGKALVEQNYALIHAVGKGAVEEPALIDIRWGDPTKPCVTLVGKGVVFDTGGLNNKDTTQMRTMKNDMAGGAHALAVAQMVMDANLPVHLRVLIPTVENANTGHSYKQGDVYRGRSGETVEIVNTDAEGRMILADTLREASHPESGAKPALIIDYATLSWFGHFELPGFASTFCNRKAVHARFLRAVKGNQEYFAVRPLMPRVGKELEASTVADILQCSDSHIRYDDLLAAALLHRNVGNDVPWIHNDLQSWRDDSDSTTAYPPHLASGARAQGIRASFDLIEDMFAAPEPGK